MVRDVPTPPPWIVDLPLDGRGFVTPAEAGWVNGEPALSKVATDRKVALGMRRRCAVCGYVMPRGTTVYRAFAQSDAAHMRQWERERSHDLGGPLHLSCVLHSAMVCPYLSERTSRLGKTNEIGPGNRRGTRAAVIGFKDFGLLLYAEPHRFLDPAKPPPHFAYVQMSDDIPYRDGNELAGRYEVAVEADAKIIDTSKPRSFWTDSDADMKRLASTLRNDFNQLAKARPAYEQVIQGVGRFVAIPS